MARQIVYRETMRGQIAAGTPPALERYDEKLLKLIPAETVAVYLSLQGVLVSAMAAPVQAVRLNAWLWIIFVIMLGLNGLYLRKVQKVTDPMQHVTMGAAFLVWVFTMGGPFRSLSFYEPFMGSLALSLFTFVAPMFYRGQRIDT
jgi:hypothetical protein